MLIPVVEEPDVIDVRSQGVKRTRAAARMPWILGRATRPR